MFQAVLLWILFSSSYGYEHFSQVINIFEQFGDLDTVLKKKLNHEQSDDLNCFTTNPFESLEESRPISQPKSSEFQGIFNLELCESLAELKEALFAGYRVDGVNRISRAMAGVWGRTETASRLGLDSAYLTTDYGFVFVRLARHHQLLNITTDRSLKPSKSAVKLITQVVPGAVGGVLRFMKFCGTHYVTSYVTGDSLHQVFVFSRTEYQRLRKMMEAYSESLVSMNQILGMFSPWHAEHVGRIICKSGDSDLELWVKQNLRSRVSVFYFLSLLKLRSHPVLLAEVYHLLGNKALLSAELRTLAPLLNDSQKSLSFLEVMDNRLQMWELNI